MVYGLTRQAVETYSQCVKLGYNWSLAMQRMKALYDHNKKFALSKQ
ncbi:hypothetical phage protein [Citrobacter phage CR8]|uniref:Hypothetical phage protein n=1 Tax=Citrobacter phage CR8 TaxID=1455076 RepID=W6PPJ7_9CAUD|nr:hypothetical protein CF79_gp05 [Citrobacter phage CR8]CDM21590.1 hypothetical phage protein [Citrobacter phage CR8]